MTTPTSPPDEILLTALRLLRTGHPTLGITKLHALLLAEHPEWTVSDKRFRKLLQREGLTLSTPNVPANGHKVDDADARWNGHYPESRMNPHLDVASYSDKVEVVYISEQKGKGLVAKVAIAEDEVVWREDPFALAPDWELFDLQRSGSACSHCALPFLPAPPPLSLDCPAAPHCSAVFCSRLCLNRGLAAGHALLCAGRNPPSRALLDFARKEEWRAFLALASAVCKILMAWERSEEEGKSIGEQWASFATLDQEERSKTLPEWEFSQERLRALWSAAHAVFLDALHPSQSDQAAQTRMRKLLRRSLPSDVEEQFFSYRGFLRGLGRVSLNLESHGGLFLLHSHINHSCIPNLSVKHPSAPNRSHPSSRIAVVARRAIEAREELTVTYVDPTWNYKLRKQALKDWGVKCACERCVEEMKSVGGEEDGANENGGEHAVNDLERELRMSFGV